MPNFFFHLTDGDTFRDDHGTPCRSIDEARVFALGVAAELGRNKPPNEIEDLMVCVTDESGKEIFRTQVVNLQSPTKADDIVRAARHPAR
jgi:hypothetical protein